jgi:hypothetical protein
MRSSEKKQQLQKFFSRDKISVRGRQANKSRSEETVIVLFFMANTLGA